MRLKILFFIKIAVVTRWMFTVYNLRLVIYIGLFIIVIKSYRAMIEIINTKHQKYNFDLEYISI